MLKNTDRILLGAISRSLFGNSIKNELIDINITENDWIEIFRESYNQTVSAIVIDGLDEFKEHISKPLYMRWIHHSLGIINRNNIINNEQNELIELLNQNNIKYVILKGMTASYNYPKPELRSLGDIDFLIDLDEKAKVKKLLLGNNYIEVDPESSHHASFDKNKVHVEMHYEITGIPYGKPGKITKNYMKNIIDFAEEVSVENNTFNIAPVHMQGIIFLLHMLRHLLKIGIGLRHLCDWAVFVDKQLNDELWESHYKNILTDCGLLDFTYALTWTCVEYIGLPKKDWMRSVDEVICENIINDILKSGNFGRKDGTIALAGKMAFNAIEYDKNTSVLSNINNAIIDSAHTYWPISKRYPILIVFAYIYFPIRQVVYMITGKRGKVDMDRLMDIVNERSNAYSKLNIFKTDK